MAFNNNFFPATYSPFGNYQLPQMPQYQSTQAQSNGIVWVQGEAAAKAHPVGAGQSALLMDSENNVFYIKSTDLAGMPQPLRIFDYVERKAANGVPTNQNDPHGMIDTSLYVTREEFEKRIAELVPACGGQSKGDDK